MGLRQTISEWVTIIKDALDFGPEFPDAMEARRVLFAQESARLQHLLEQTQKASQEKDQLIARLQAVGAVAGNMVVDGPAYYIRKANTLEGPFCTSCFQRNHEIMRIAPAPKPKGSRWDPRRLGPVCQVQDPVSLGSNQPVPESGSSPHRQSRAEAASPKRDESRMAPPTSQGTGPDDRRPEDRRQKTEDGTAIPSVLRPPSSALRCRAQAEPSPSANGRPGKGHPNAEGCVGDPEPEPRSHSSR